MRLSLGPLQFFWPRQQVMDFYREAASSPVDVIYLGETVCPKRREMRLPDWLALGQQLQEAGKEVVLSSLVLVNADSDLKALRKLCRQGEFMVEANDLSAVNVLANAGVPFVCGPAINVYNAAALRLLAGMGMQRWVMPVELSGAALGALLDEVAQDAVRPQVEVFAYGHLPLAYSARCFTARFHDRLKDDCELVCIDYPDGLPVRSQEGQLLFNLNGIQTQSGLIYNLLGEWSTMANMGVDILRINPQQEGIFDVLQRFESARRGEPQVLPLRDLTCDGYWYAEPGMNLHGGPGLALDQD